MNEHLLLAPLLESYFRRRLTKQRNATSATLAGYRDALRMLILFAAAHLGKKPAALALEDLDRDLVLAFLDELEEKRTAARASGRTTPSCSCWPTSNYYVTEKPWVAGPGWR
ncbi:site-specific recombinase XerD [Bradyrhizobium sp. USDA 4503]